MNHVHPGSTIRATHRTHWTNWLRPLRMKLLVLPLLAALVVLATPAWADVSRDDAAAAAARVTAGRVLSVEKIEAAQRPVWRVKVVTAQGEVRVILIDAVTGRPL